LRGALEKGKTRFLFGCGTRKTTRKVASCGVYETCAKGVGKNGGTGWLNRNPGVGLLRRAGQRAGTRRGEPKRGILGPFDKT